LKENEAAIAFGRQALSLNSSYVKTFSRLGTALSNLGRKKEATEIFERGLLLEPENALLKKGLRESGGDKQEVDLSSGGIDKLLQNPQLMNLAMNMLGNMSKDSDMMTQMKETLSGLEGDKKN